MTQVPTREHITAVRRSITPSCTLIAVSKYASVAQTQAMIDAGLTVFGENKVQDAISKQAALNHPTVKWVMLGHLQRNKAKKAVAHFDEIHSVDSIRLADAIERAAAEHGKQLPILIQVNWNTASQQHGFDDAAIESAVQHIRNNCPSLSLQGIMTIGPNTADTSKLETFYRHVALRFSQLQETFPELIALSMGMSSDYQVAQQHGATMVRLGRILYTEAKEE